MVRKQLSSQQGQVVIGIIIVALTIYVLIILSLYMIYPAITGKPFHTLETYTVKTNIVNVTTSEHGWYGRTNYYVETDEGNVYQTSLAGIEPNHAYYLTISKTERIQRYDKVIQ